MISLNNTVEREEKKSPVLCSFSHMVYLIITSSSGGVWKYPIRFVSIEPLPDDVIVIKSKGLDKESSVSFRLTSQTK